VKKRAHQQGALGDTMHSGSFWLVTWNGETALRLPKNVVIPGGVPWEADTGAVA